MKALLKTEFPGLTKVSQGKVRDDHLLFGQSIGTRVGGEHGKPS